MKPQREERILQIIQEKQIETQEELAACLRADGYEVTQATVSRDIRRIGLVKNRSASGKVYYSRPETPSTPEDEKYTKVLKSGFVSVQAAENILVIKTVSGMAMAVAAALDSIAFPEIVGTIAGDDTIMCAVTGKRQAKVLAAKIEHLIRTLN